jgi:hypothetical protein
MQPPIVVVDPVRHSGHGFDAGVELTSGGMASVTEACSYEWHNRKVPGQGLRRVLYKICPEI